MPSVMYAITFLMTSRFRFWSFSAFTVRSSCRRHGPRPRRQHAVTPTRCPTCQQSPRCRVCQPGQLRCRGGSSHHSHSLSYRSQFIDFTLLRLHEVRGWRRARRTRGAGRGSHESRELSGSASTCSDTVARSRGLHRGYSFIGKTHTMTSRLPTRTHTTRGASCVRTRRESGH